MPNYCQNFVTFTHSDPKMIERFTDLESYKYLFNAFVPMPEELKDTVSPVVERDQELIEKHGYDNWYDWAVNNWGTKWDVPLSECNPYVEGNSITLNFDTAWGPPVSFYKKMEGLGFHVKGYYYEPGMMICGWYENGDDDCFIIENDVEWIKNNIPSEIDQMFSISEDIQEMLSYNEDDD